MQDNKRIEELIEYLESYASDWHHTLRELEVAESLKAALEWVISDTELSVTDFWKLSYKKRPSWRKW